MSSVWHGLSESMVRSLVKLAYRTRHPPGGKPPGVRRVTRAPYAATLEGMGTLRERSPAPWSLAGPWASRPAGCLPAPAFGDLCPAASCGLPHGVDRRVRHRRHGMAMCLSAASGSAPLLAFRRKRLQRASRISSHLALLPGAGRLHMRDGWRHPRPVATNDGRSLTPPAMAGDSGVAPQYRSFRN